MALFHLYADAFRQLRLAWYCLARDQLTRRDPCHPDLPGIVLKINRLSSQ